MLQSEQRKLTLPCYDSSAAEFSGKCCIR